MSLNIGNLGALQDISNTQLRVTQEDYRSAAQLFWGDAAAYAYDTFARLNRELFAGELPALPIVLGITAYGHCLGVTRHGDSPRISLHVGLFNRKGHLAVDDVLTHEMVHAHLILRGEDPKHNHDPWCCMITQLSPHVLGRTIIARPVRPRRVKDSTSNKSKVVRLADPGALTRGQLARWPYSLRPDDYDFGPKIPVPTY